MALVDVDGQQVLSKHRDTVNFDQLCELHFTHVHKVVDNGDSFYDLTVVFQEHCELRYQCLDAIAVWCLQDFPQQLIVVFLYRNSMSELNCNEFAQLLYLLRLWALQDIVVLFEFLVVTVGEELKPAYILATGGHVASVGGPVGKTGIDVVAEIEGEPGDILIYKF